MKERLISVRQTWAAILALVLASALSCGLALLRVVQYGHIAYGFFFWNLILAWVPVVAALAVYALASARAAAGS